MHHLIYLRKYVISAVEFLETRKWDHKVDGRSRKSRREIGVLCLKNALTVSIIDLKH